MHRLILKTTSKREREGEGEDEEEEEKEREIAAPSRMHDIIKCEKGRSPASLKFSTSALFFVTFHCMLLGQYLS